MLQETALGQGAREHGFSYHSHLELCLDDICVKTFALNSKYFCRSKTGISAISYGSIYYWLNE